jgi:hypothetical protein
VEDTGETTAAFAVGTRSSRSLHLAWCRAAHSTKESPGLWGTLVTRRSAQLRRAQPQQDPIELESSAKHRFLRDVRDSSSAKVPMSGVTCEVRWSASMNGARTRRVMGRPAGHPTSRRVTRALRHQHCDRGSEQRGGDQVALTAGNGTDRERSTASASATQCRDPCCESGARGDEEEHHRDQKNEHLAAALRIADSTPLTRSAISSGRSSSRRRWSTRCSGRCWASHLASIFRAAG